VGSVDQYPVFEGAVSFKDINMLFLIWVAPAVFFIIFYGMTRRRRLMQKFSTDKGLNTIAPESGSRNRWIKSILVLLSLVFSAIALAGPQHGFRWQEIEQKGIDIIVALDCSRSMLATDIKPTRLDRAKREIVDLLTMLQGDRVGLTAFAGTAFLQCPLTLDYESFYIFLNALSPDFLPVGGTDISAALETAKNAFSEKDSSEKAIILITDGESTSGNPAASAEALAKAGIKLFCVGVGNPDGAPVPDNEGRFRKDNTGTIVISKLDEETLKSMALRTGGAYVRSVSGDMDLDLIYTKRIRESLTAENRTAGRKKIMINCYQWVLMAAILACIIDMFCSPGYKKKMLLLLLMGLCALSPKVEAGSGSAELKQGLKAYRKGDFDAARKAFTDVQIHHPKRPELFFNIGNTYYKQGKYSEAEKQFVESLTGDDPAVHQKAHYNLGNTYFRQGKLQEAKTSYETAIETAKKLNIEDKQAEANLELVKKLIEQQPKQPSQGKGEDSENKEKKDSENHPPSDSQNNASQKQTGENQKAESGQKKESGPSESNPDETTFGDQMDTQNQPENKDAEKSAVNQLENPKKQPAKENQEAAPIHQAERILNRLQDKPGRAMMPNYRKRSIEKDW
jgi:Ca-activated chloride channel family protein